MSAASQGVKITVEQGEVQEYRSDVLVLKYAQALYGADAAVARLLGIFRDPGALPSPGDTRLVSSEGRLAADRVLFVGVPSQAHFGYGDIRAFARAALRTLAAVAQQAATVTMTVHGVGFGLDESEAFRAQVAGLADAITRGEFPRGLASLTIVEQDPGRAERLGALLKQLMPHGGIPVGSRRELRELDYSAPKEFGSVGYASGQKPHVFVAMPFVKEMEDHYHYGIAPTVRDHGFLCERADQDTFVGDVLDRVKDRISTASLVVADLSASNPNVYLEVGYAWGCGRPTLLLVRDPGELKFDVRGQRCLVYQSIRDLEEQLRKELHGLKAGGLL